MLVTTRISGIEKEEWLRFIFVEGIVQDYSRTFRRLKHRVSNSQKLLKPPESNFPNRTGQRDALFVSPYRSEFEGRHPVGNANDTKSWKQEKIADIFNVVDVGITIGRLAARKESKRRGKEARGAIKVHYFNNRTNSSEPAASDDRKQHPLAVGQDGKEMPKSRLPNNRMCSCSVPGTTQLSTSTNLSSFDEPPTPARILIPLEEDVWTGNRCCLDDVGKDLVEMTNDNTTPRRVVWEERREEDSEGEDRKKGRKEAYVFARKSRGRYWDSPSVRANFLTVLVGSYGSLGTSEHTVISKARRPQPFIYVGAYVQADFRIGPINANETCWPVAFKR
uniref:Uncharacterized protein n=1 Tax=Vespula pensylvanica TaxID=30213 RepID=A0A834UFB5_VESPE|nr:hypothetical protein H0235_003648 [Vespula pensylvanica]